MASSPGNNMPASAATAWFNNELRAEGMAGTVDTACEQHAISTRKTNQIDPPVQPRSQFSCPARGSDVD